MGNMNTIGPWFLSKKMLQHFGTTAGGSGGQVCQGEYLRLQLMLPERSRYKQSEVTEKQRIELKKAVLEALRRRLALIGLLWTDGSPQPSL